MSGGGQQNLERLPDPSRFMEGYVRQGLDKGSELFKGPDPTFYSGSTVADFGDRTRSAQGGLYNFGMNPSGTTSDAMGAARAFSRGDLMDSHSLNAFRDLGGSNNFAANPVVGNLNNLGANGSNLGANMQGMIGDLTSGGGNVAGYTRGAIGDITSAGAGSNSQIRSDIRDLITGQAQAANPAFAQLQATTGGSYLNGNPYLDSMYDKAARGLTRNFQTSVMPSIDSNASAGGRFGSGFHRFNQSRASQILGEGLGDLATGMYGGNYAQERQNQLNAANTLGGQYLQGQGLRASTAATSADQAARDAALRLQATGQVSSDMSGDLGRRMQAASTIGGMQAQDVQNQLAANQQLGSAYDSGAARQLQALQGASNTYNANRAQQLQAMGMAPQFQQMELDRLNAARGVGSEEDQRQQALINEAIQRHEFAQNAPWSNLNRYQSILSGQPSGRYASAVQQPSLLQNVGGGLAGLGGIGTLINALGQNGLRFW